MDYVNEAWRLLVELRGRTPRVHCITNDAAQAFTADILLAAGAIPSLSLAENEIEAFVGSSDALLINLGTLDERRLAAVERCVPMMREAGKPWVLDPVFVERSKPRLMLATTLLTQEPTAIRGNRAECAALADAAPVFSAFLSEHASSVVAMTGEIDVVFGGAQPVSISNGHSYMAQATAIGCALSALVAAFLVTGAEAPVAVASAVLVWGVAGEIAGAKAGGPGTFRPLLIDALHGFDEETLKAHARIEKGAQ